MQGDLCLIECLVTVLASTRWMPVTPSPGTPRPMWESKMSPDTAQRPLGANPSPVGNHRSITAPGLQTVPRELTDAENSCFPFPAWCWDSSQGKSFSLPPRRREHQKAGCEGNTRWWKSGRCLEHKCSLRRGPRPCRYLTGETILPLCWGWTWILMISSHPPPPQGHESIYTLYQEQGIRQ